MYSSTTGCPTRYRTRHFFNNFTTKEDIATKFETDLSHCVRNVKEKNILLFKFPCSIFIGVRIIKEMPGSVASGTPCIFNLGAIWRWAINETSVRFTPRSASTRYSGDWVGPRTGLGGCVENISYPIVVRAPNRPAPSESLYRLRYPRAPCKVWPNYCSKWILQENQTPTIGQDCPEANILLTPYLHTPWSRVLLEKLTGSPHFMEPDGSSPHSQAHATCPYPELAPSSPHTHIPLPEDPS